MLQKFWFPSLIIFLVGAVYLLYRSSLSSYGGIFDRDVVATTIFILTSITAVDLYITRIVAKKKGISGAILFFVLFFVIVFGILLSL